MCFWAARARGERTGSRCEDGTERELQCDQGQHIQLLSVLVILTVVCQFQSLLLAEKGSGRALLPPKTS
eukprot:3144415-Rhodomonas_salina.2